MNRLRCTISCPFDTYSGYGKRALDLVKQIIRVFPNWDVEVLSQRWGDCRRGFLRDHGEYELMGHIVDHITQKQDIWIQITIPNEFQAVGKFNIGITAAMETTLCDPSWIEGVNRMDLVLTSSEHGKKTLIDSKWTNNSTGQEIKVEKPVEVLFEGINTETYHMFEAGRIYKTPVLKGIKNSWNFLCVGHWLKGDFGQDRKNIGYTIKAFLETFKDVKGQVPGLILKTSQAVSSCIDKEEILKRIYSIRESVDYKNSLPNIYLLHGDLTDSEMNQLYNDSRVKAMVSFTKGEGFGRPLLEFASTGKPVIASGWSGQLDFLNKDYSYLVGGTIERVHSSAVQPHMILPEASWFKPDDNQVVGALNEVFKHYDTWKLKALQWKKLFIYSLTVENMGHRFKQIVEQYVPEFPEQVELKLPIKFE